MSKSKKKKNFWKSKIKCFFIVVAGLMAIIVILFFLGNHLLQIQVPERLRYIKDYKDFTLAIEPVSDCTNQVYSLFQIDDTIYNGVCIYNVFVQYGKTKAPLELVLQEEYLALPDLLKKMSRIDTVEDKEKSVSHYEYRRSEIEKENYRVTVIPKEYQGVTLKEVTFEIYSEPDVVKDNIVGDDSGVQVTGVVEIG